MERNEIYQLVLTRSIQCFTPTEEELQMIEHRLKQYSDEELKHLEANFTSFGVDEILECMYSAVVAKEIKMKKKTKEKGGRYDGK